MGIPGESQERVNPTREVSCALRRTAVDVGATGCVLKDGATEIMLEAIETDAPALSRFRVVRTNTAFPVFQPELPPLILTPGGRLQHASERFVGPTRGPFPFLRSYSDNASARTWVGLVW